MKISLPKIYSQNDPLWKDKTLGTKGTIGAYGCLISDVAMMLTYFGHEETPDSLNEKLKANKGYVNGNLFVWGSIGKIYPDVMFLNQIKTPGRLTISQMDEIRKWLDIGYPVFLQIDTIPQTSEFDEHWILAVDYDGDDFICADPWDGAIKRITSWGIEPQKIIYAYACYSGQIPQTQTGYYKGYDLTNQDSMKVAIDVLVRLQSGELVEKSSFDEEHKLRTEIETQLQGLKTTCGEHQHFIDSLWDKLSPVGKEKNTANILGEVAELIEKEQNFNTVESRYKKTTEDQQKTIDESQKEIERLLGVSERLGEANEKLELALKEKDELLKTASNEYGKIVDIVWDFVKKRGGVTLWQKLKLFFHLP